MIPLTCLLALLCTAIGFATYDASAAAGLFIAGVALTMFFIKLARLEEQERK